MGAYRHVSGDFPFAALRSAKTRNPTVTSVSFGGGAGVYKHVSGDFPIAALSGTKKKFNSVQNLSVTKNFVLIQYNVHSLINFEERMQRVLQELEGRHWDAVAFSETWRSECDEAWKTRWGHSWFGSAGTRGTRGVGILLHSRWTHVLFRPVSERLCVLDVKLMSEIISIFSVYMPHADYPDEEVDVVYTQLDLEVARSKNRKTKIVIAGDWNARVGQAQDDDDDQLVGQSNFGSRNERGTQFVKWCTMHGYMITNTFSAETDQMWTYQNGRHQHQLDYIVISRNLKARFTSSEVLCDVDIGSDHLPVQAKFKISNTKEKQTQKRSGNKKFTANPIVYDISLQSSLQNYNPTGMDTEEQNNFLESVMLQAADEADVQKPESKATRCKGKMRTVETLIDKRRRIKDLPELTAKERRQMRNSVSKQIQKEIKRVLGRRRQDKIEQILLEFRGLKDITLCTTAKRRSHIVEMEDEHGHKHSDQDGIAEVFASFYEKLYTGRKTVKGPVTARTQLKPFTREELTDALSKMSKGKAADDSGIVAEMLKHGNKALLDAILNLFNDIVVGGQGIPSKWKMTRLTVIFKKGNAKLPSNYRPIAITPILYKLFSRMFCERIQTTLMSQQSSDQAAYRAGYSTEDHLLTVTLMTELCSEWRSELWLGLIDFEKAFDTVEHDVLWEVLKDQGLHSDYIDIIKRLYDGQTAYVQAGVASRRFSLLRGVKQGDPVSALLFIAVMEQCFRSLKKRWKSTNRRRTGQYFGIVIDDPENTLSNLRFADDILLFANSSSDLTKMIAHLRDESARYGLRMHLGKTKILSNIPPEERPESLKVGATSIEVLKEGAAERYLGRKLTLDHYHATELANRISAGWAAFTKHKVALCDQKCHLRLRLKLFESTVTPVVLYGSSCWTMWADTERLLRTNRRRMLRLIVGVRRRPNETWVEYVQRSTWRSEELAAKYKLVDWCDLQRKRKLQMMQRVQTMQSHRWPVRILEWTPWFRTNSTRSEGRPRKRWTDSKKL